MDNNSPEKLIRELEACEASIAAMAVLFPGHIRMVYGCDNGRRSKLDSLLNQGGKPLGLVLFHLSVDEILGRAKADSEDDGSTFGLSPFEPRESRAWEQASTLLSALALSVLTDLRRGVFPFDVVKDDVASQEPPDPVLVP